MQEINKKTKELKQKYKNHIFLMRLLRLKNLSYEEFKLIILLNTLSNDTNCARISGENLRAAGLHHNAVKLEVLTELRKKQIILILNKTTDIYIKEKICRDCILRYGSKECNKRAPIFYLNKNHNTWILKKKIRYNEPLIEALLQDNGIMVPIEEINLNKQIKFRKEFDSKTEEERITEAIKAFDLEREALKNKNK